MISGRTPEEYRDFFAEIFADLDANPRETGVRFKADDLTIDLVNGNPVFIVGNRASKIGEAESFPLLNDDVSNSSNSRGKDSSAPNDSSAPDRLAADFRGRWLPEHPVPLRFHGSKTHVLRFVPTTGNRVKVRM